MNLRDELRALERLAPVLDVLPGPAYLVGGSVRDLLLGRPPSFDFDVAVVGDGERYARELCERLARRVTAHDRFGTATVHDGDEHLAIASWRGEVFPAPAGLPEAAPRG